MYKKLLAVFAAAACAAVIVGFIPTPQPASAAKAPQANVVAIGEDAGERRGHREEGSGVGGAVHHLHARLAALRPELSPR